MRPGSILGHPVLRTEDPDLLTGRARFLDDLPAEGALHAVFVRSMFAHARLGEVDAAAAGAMPGVVAVVTAADLAMAPLAETEDVPEVLGRPLLAGDVVRFVGEAFAVVLAGTRAEAMDAAELVAADLDPLPVVVDPLLALEPDAPLLHPEHGSNVVITHVVASDPDPLAGAEVVVRARFVNQRVAPVPMEVNGAHAVPGRPVGGITLWAPAQAPHWWRDILARRLGLPEDRVRVVAPKVGGGFGAKIPIYPEHVVISALALRFGRPVRWVETRSESFVAMTHGRGQVQDVELGAGRDGVVTGLRVRVIQDVGAYPSEAATLPPLTGLMASGPYAIPRIDFRASSVTTNTTPLGAYRGAGRPEATWFLERSMDLLAAELHLDPAEVRRRNLISPDAFPYTTPTDAVYDSGEYGAALERALELAGIPELRREQAARRERGEVLQLGMGVSVYVEVTGWGSEFGSVAVGREGTVTVRSGTAPQGQGHETAYAQLAAEVLSVPVDAVTVAHSDTAAVPRGEGTMGSRSLQVGGSSVLKAGQAVREKAMRLAAHLLEAAEEDIAFVDGRIGVAGAPASALTWAELAAAAADPARLPTGMGPGLEAVADFETEGSTYPFGAHVAVVEVDTETGDARLLRHIAVDDCGRILNPMLVEGQVHGGVAQGAAQALFEAMVYDETGNPVTSNLATYSMPSAAELPNLETANTETPTSLNPLGAKGIGESGTIGSGPAVHGAVVDALSHLGIRHLDTPLTPERVWRSIRDARVDEGRRP